VTASCVSSAVLHDELRGHSGKVVYPSLADIKHLHNHFSRVLVSSIASGKLTRSTHTAEPLQQIINLDIGIGGSQPGRRCQYPEVGATQIVIFAVEL